MDFKVNGDVAPDGRPNYVYATNNITSIGEDGKLLNYFLL
jgi:hypothetical protein